METADADMWLPDALIRFSLSLLKCKLCISKSVMFTSKEAFIAHIQNIHLSEETQIMCKSCPLRFQTVDDLNYHLENDHQILLPNAVSSSTSINGATNKMDKQVLAYRESDDELQSMYDKHASTIIMENRQYYYCSLCGFKFSSHAECQGHFTGSYHSQKKEEVSSLSLKSTSDLNQDNNVNSDQKLETKSRSRRKRTLPMQCRRPQNEDPDNEESSGDVEDAENSPDEGLVPWTASNPIRFSLMQSDRKRLAVSCPKDDKNHVQSLNNSLSNSPKDPAEYENGQKDVMENYLNNVNSYVGADALKDYYAKLHNHIKGNGVVDYTKLANGTSFRLQDGGGLSTSNFETPQDLSVKSRTTYLQDLPVKSRTADSTSEFKTSSKSDFTTSQKNEVVHHKCHRCDAVFTVLEDLCTHYKETHMGPQHSALGDQHFKVIWLKHLLPQFVIAHESGCVSRDELLVRMAIVMDENALWGPACNKAVRETFPDSSALRKGKFKKTYYFGVTYIDSSAPAASPGVENSDEDVVQEDEEDAGSDPGVYPTSHQEVERLIMLLPDIIQYTGSCDSSVARETVLGMLSSRVGDATMLTWASQCNKAVRLVFPHVNIRRKGKYKTTYYFGLEVIKEKKKSWPDLHRSNSWMRSQTSSGTGPPVVNVKDLTDCKGPSHLSRLTPQGQPPAADLSFLYDIINKVDPGSSDNTLDKDRTSSSPKSPLLPPPVVDINSNNTIRGQQQSSPGGSGTNHLENLEKLMLLHPGPFVTARIFSRRFQRIAPNTDKVVAAMTMLQGRGLGQMFTLKTGNSKVFFKAIPTKSLEVALSVLGVRFIDYQVMFCERDSKLEDSLHDRLRTFYPQPDVLSSFYSH